ncbi:MAG: hypothetical protein KAG10_10850, partial [Methylococcales bacterium]|nr:hypothetical protein [Methylococcales bacterium]
MTSCSAPMNPYQDIAVASEVAKPLGQNAKLFRYSNKPSSLGSTATIDPPPSETVNTEDYAKIEQNPVK